MKGRTAALLASLTLAACLPSTDGIRDETVELKRPAWSLGYEPACALAEKPGTGRRG